jgi:hypothetical protein
MVNWQNRSWCVPLERKTERRPGRILYPVVLLLLTAAGCSRADTEAAKPTASTESATCRPASRGFLRARVQGSVDAELDWAGGVPQCLGGVRPGGDGVRLLYKGLGADGQPLLVVIGAGPLRKGEAARHVPVNLTLVREGSGEFFATQGNDKCEFDSVAQEPIAGSDRLYLLTGRGFCTQPARSVGGLGSVLLSRFDLEAIVDYGE